MLNTLDDLLSGFEATGDVSPWWKSKRTEWMRDFAIRTLKSGTSRGAGANDRFSISWRGTIIGGRESSLR